MNQEQIIEYINQVNSYFKNKKKFIPIKDNDFSCKKEEDTYSLFYDQEASTDELQAFILHEVIDVYLKESIGKHPHFISDIICKQKIDDYQQLLEDYTSKKLKPLNSVSELLTNYFKEHLEDIYNCSMTRVWLRLDNMRLLSKLIPE